MRKFFTFIIVIVTASSMCAQYISELDYDVPGVDNAGLEFVEVFYPTGTNSADHSIIRINGSNPLSGVVYTSPALSSVLCTAVAGGELCVYSGASDCLQNGGNDAVILFNTVTSSVVQAIAYEGNVTVSGAASPTAIQGLTINSVGTDTGASSVSLRDDAGDGTFELLALNRGALPVEFVDFNINSRDGEVQIYFSTASEINNDFFTIERSANGVRFEEIGRIDGAGNSNRLLQYQFTDKNPLNGISYYKIKQTDFDGTFAYSTLKSVRTATENVKITPRSTHAHLLLSTSLERYDIKIYSLNGTEVMAQENLSYDQNISIDNLNVGIYFVKIQSGDLIETIKIEKH